MVQDNHIDPQVDPIFLDRHFCKKRFKQSKYKIYTKIRSDCYFASNKILKLDLEKYKYDNKFKIFNERIITSSIGSLNQRNSNILYNYSDWFNLGLTSDLKIIKMQTLTMTIINYFTRYSSKKIYMVRIGI